MYILNVKILHQTDLSKSRTDILMVNSPEEAAIVLWKQQLDKIPLKKQIKLYKIDLDKEELSRVEIPKVKFFN
jgi:hypothetical protein